MRNKRFGLYYECLKIMFGDSATRRTKPFNKRSSVRTFLSVHSRPLRDELEVLIRIVAAHVDINSLLVFVGDNANEFGEYVAPFIDHPAGLSERRERHADSPGRHEIGRVTSLRDCSVGGLPGTGTFAERQKLDVPVLNLLAIDRHMTGKFGSGVFVARMTAAARHQ